MDAIPYHGALKVILFGATGMIGQGVLRECLLDAEIDLVETIGRSMSARPSAVPNAKLREIIRANLFNYADVEDQIRGFDACFFCLGKTSAGLTEAEYDRVTYQLAIAAAETLARLNPQMTFVSGAGADSSEKGSTIWARVKGKTENAILRLPFKAACAFRPAAIVAMNGEQSRTAAYRVMYTVLRPVVPLLRRLFPAYVVTTEEMGRAMILVAKYGPPKPVMESADIGALARQ
jgi:uncharacterized protein YbjT (DUF2867 family)